MTQAEITFGEGEAALKRTVALHHRFFPPRGPEGRRGSWSLFICPCGCRVRRLRLYDGRVCCHRCDGLRNRPQNHDRSAAIARWRDMLYSGRKVTSRGRMEQALRRALIRERRKALEGFDEDSG